MDPGVPENLRLAMDDDMLGEKTLCRMQVLAKAALDRFQTIWIYCSPVFAFDRLSCRQTGFLSSHTLLYSLTHATPTLYT